MIPTDLRSHLPALSLAAAVALEFGAWAAGGHVGTATFAWFRVQAQAGLGGFGQVVAAGAAAAGIAWWAGRRWPGRWLPGAVGAVVLSLAALLLHLALLDTPQAQPDTVTYFVAAQRFARAPVHTLLHWPALAWSGPEARFHLPFPAVPLLLGLAFRLFGERWIVVEGWLALTAVTLPLAVAWVGWSAGRPREGLAAGWLALGLPFLQAQTGWLLVDVPLLIALCLAWGALLRVRSGWTLALALLACLPAFATKASAALFLLGPAAALATERLRPPRRWLLPALGLIGLGLLVALHPPRWREEAGTWIEALAAMGLHLRPSLWVLGLGIFAQRERLSRVLAGVLLALPVLVLYAPAEHCARYALPLGVALCIGAAPRLGRAATAGLVVAGVALGLLGYRPLLAHNQAVNLRDAARALEARGVRAVEVWSDQPGTNFAPAALAALVDLYVAVPVRFGGALEVGAPEDKRHWWEQYRPPPWHLAQPGEVAPDGVLLALFGAAPDAFEAGPGAGLELLEEVSRYRASSMLLPSRVRLYRRAVDDGNAGDKGE
ncbi:MAG: hypothetical protein ABIO70_05990 [Pseudomonadota bacterium]